MSRALHILKWAALLAILLPALVRCVTILSPTLYFATDPLYFPTPPDGLGPAGSATLDILVLLGAAAALLHECLRGRPLERPLVALALLPAIVAVLTWEHSLDHTRLTLAWSAAVFGAVGIAHLAREMRLRLLAAGALLALALPLAVKGIYQFTVEHAFTVEEFERNQAAILAGHGWSADSASARLYVRRLTQAEATGWFGLANVYGSMMAALAAAWIGLTLAAARSRLSSGWIGVVGLIAGLALAGLTMSFSKGAIGAGLIGIGLSVAVLLPKRWRRRARTRTFALTLALVVVALAAVVGRGLAGERITADGYSLLFRWHYWQGAASMLQDHWMTGVGPAGFKSAYLLHKPPLSPEEVADPHNVLIAWIACLGAAGLFWAALWWLLLRRASPSWPAVLEHRGENRTPDQASPTGEPTSSMTRADWLPALGIAGVVALTGWILNRESMMIDFRLLWWPMAMLAFALAIALLPWLARESSLMSLRWAVWAGLVVLAVHGQIEMTFTQPASAAAAMFLIGTAAARLPSQPLPRGNRTLDLGLTGLLVAVVALAGVAALQPVLKHERHASAAQQVLVPVGAVQYRLSQAAADVAPQQRIDTLREASEIAASAGVDANVAGLLREAESAVAANDSRRLTTLLGEAATRLDATRRRLAATAIPQAISELERASETLIDESMAIRVMARLHMQHALIARQDAEMGDPEQHAARAVEAALRLAARRPGDSADLAFAALVLRDAHGFNPLAGRMEHAVALQKQAAALDPYGVATAHRLAELLDAAGQTDEAIAWYRRTLDLNANLRLDPLKGLTDSEVRTIERRLAEPPTP